MSAVQIRWTLGIEPHTVQFIDRSTLCAKYGRAIQFRAIDGSSQFVFHPTARSVSLVSVHPCSHIFAVAESDVLNPKIHVYDYPYFNEISSLNDGGQLQITRVAFSASEYLLATSGIPDFKLTIWNYQSGEPLCSTVLKSEPIFSSISFNPINWRQILALDDSKINFWSVEQCEKIFTLTHKELKLPAEYCLPGQVTELQPDTRSTTRTSARMTQEYLELPKSSIAGVHSDYFHEFEESLDGTPRMKAVCHIWSEIGDAFIGCVGGQLLKMDMERFSIRLLHNPQLNTAAALNSIGQTTVFWEKDEIGERTSRTPLGDRLPEGEADISTVNNLQCMVYSKQGIYACGLDGILRLLNLAEGGAPASVLDTMINVTNLHQLEDGGQGVALAFNSLYDQLALSSSFGRVDILRMSTGSENEPFVTLIPSYSGGQFVGVDSLYPLGELVVALQFNGVMQIWQAQTGELVSHYSLETTCYSMATCPSSKYVAIGSTSGHLLVVDCSKPKTPRLAHRTRLHKKTITFIKFDQLGRVLFTAADDGYIILLDARPSTRWQVLGCVEFPGEIQDLTIEVCDADDRIHVCALSSIDQTKVGNRITYFTVTDDIVSNYSKHHASIKRDFKDDAISKMVLIHLNGGFGCALQPNDTPVSLYTVDKRKRTVERIQLPLEVPKKAGNKASIMDYDLSVKLDCRHEDPCAKLCFNLDKSVIASFGQDGYLRLVGLQEEFSYSMRFHDSQHGGIHRVTFSPDGSRLYSIGGDGSLFCLHLNIPESLKEGAQKSLTRLQDHVSVSMTAENSALSQLVPQDTYEKMRQDATLSLLKNGSLTDDLDVPNTEVAQIRRQSLISTEATTIAEEEPTWMQSLEMDAIRDEETKHANEKQEIKRKLKYIRDTIRQMVQENSTLPDLEKLERQEFELDSEEQARIMAETDKVVQGVREEIEMDMLAKQFVRDVIRRECWELMKVKGRALCSFNGLLQVNNFPLKARTEEELNVLRDVIQQRKIEVADTIECQKYEKIIQKTNSEEKENEEVDDEFSADTDLAKNQALQITTAKELLYDQLSLTTREQKINQIILLQDVIYRLKEGFNKEFDDIFQRKEQELSKIREKNSRIKKILLDLNQPELYAPDLDFNTLEKPEKLLTVDDSEVTVEKYLSPEQRKRLEEEQLAEEERRRRERADNWRERGLDEMMGGVLEVKKEDELKKEIPKPAFMLQKPEDEWTEEERKAAQEYERKVKELMEEREKFKKQLEAEYKKLTGFIEDGKIAFDDVLAGFFTKYLKTFLSVLQEELKIWRVKFNLLQEEELDQRHTELREMSAEKRKEVERIQDFVQRSKQIYEVHNDAYLTATAEEKVMEKNFRKEFHDVPASALEKLMKTLRKPKRNPTGQLAPTQMEDYSPFNPYADKPSTARRRDTQARQYDHIMHDLDEDRPAEIEEHIWHRFCGWRRKKFQRDMTIKRMALELAEIESFMKRRQAEYREHLNEEQKLQELLDHIIEEKHNFQANLEIQLVMKQGQVEVDVPDGFIHDFTDSLLLDKKRIEDLNEKICKLGEVKVQHMMVGKEFKKLFVHLEWELRRMLMEYNELQIRLKDIQRFRITREVQRYLDAENYEALIATELQKLDKAIEMLKSHHEKSMNEKKGRLKQIVSVKTKKMQDKNNALLDDLQEMNVTLNERLQVYETVDQSDTTEGTRAKRYQEILQRQKLVDIAKSQAKEVAVLRAEVERLRMRTFPALVQNK